MQKLFILAVVVAVTLCQAEAKGNSPNSMKWEDFKSYHGKSYQSDEHEASHKVNFIKNVADIQAHNAAFSQGKVTYTKELNKFADMDPKEFNTRNGLKLPVGPLPAATRSLRSIEKRAIPASLDYRTTGKVSPVKDQGNCGSCWAFSANGALESQVLIKSNVNRSLSEQQLVSCDTSGNDGGCNGGLYIYAWDYVINLSKNGKGLAATSSYPYTSGSTGQSGTCNTAATNQVAQKMSSYTWLGGSTDDQIKQALVTYGPLSVAIDASDWMLASDNVYSCSTVHLDHGVLLVGYGTTPAGKAYWIVKNSWGTGWGDKGFFKLAQGSGDCGITQYAAVPTI